MSSLYSYLGDEDEEPVLDPERDAMLDTEDDEPDPEHCEECGDPLKGRDDSRLCTACRLQILADQDGDE